MIMDFRTFGITHFVWIFRNFILYLKKKGLNNPGIKHVESCNLLCTFKFFKEIFGFERYLDFLNLKSRTALSRLWLSSHTLYIETGRYGRNRIERSERKCTLCNMNDIEDEFHFVCKCPCYDVIRLRYLKPYFYRRPSMWKFVAQMQSKNSKIVNSLCHFIREAFAISNVLINN